MKKKPILKIPNKKPILKGILFERLISSDTHKISAKKPHIPAVSTR